MKTLRLSGEIDLQAARELGQALNELVGTAGGAATIDLSDVTFIDSTGLGALVRARERLRRQSRTLILVCPPGPVRQVFELTRLLGTFVVVPDVPSTNAVAEERAA